MREWAKLLPLLQRKEKDMYAINGTNITLTRGDSLYLTVTATQNGETYTPAEGDSIRFAMKRNYTDTETVMVKTIPTDTMILHIEPTDTEALSLRATYVYDIELTKANGDVDTFIKGKFFIDDEVL